MGRAKDAEIEGGVEVTEGIMEGDFCTGDLVSYCSAFSGMEMSCAVI
jgi:hypothetical protein